MSTDTAKLIRVDDPKQPEILLTDDVTNLGRAGSCQVVIDNDFASRRHAQLVCRDEIYWLRDLGSKNGTLLDDKPVTQEMPLRHGAVIKIGAATFHFVDPAATRTQPGMANLDTILRVDATLRQVWLQDSLLSPALSVKQFDLLLYLYQRAGEAVSKDELAVAVWPEAAAAGITDYQVDKMVSRVRDRIGKELIETVWGYGYRLSIHKK